MLKPRWRFASTTIVISVALLLAGCATTNSSFSTCDINRQLQPENSTSPDSYDDSQTCRPRVETTEVRGERYNYSKAYKKAQQECARIQAENENQKLIVVHPVYESGMIPEYSLTYTYAQRSGAAINAGGHYSHVIVAPRDRVFITPPQPVAFVVKEGNAPELRDESLEALLAKANEMTGRNTEVQEVKTISDAEYEAWKKHCSGQTLTNEEHSLLYRQGGQIPKEFIDDCNWLK